MATWVSTKAESIGCKADGGGSVLFASGMATGDSVGVCTTGAVSGCSVAGSSTSTSSGAGSTGVWVASGAGCAGLSATSAKIFLTSAKSGVFIAGLGLAVSVGFGVTASAALACLATAFCAFICSTICANVPFCKAINLSISAFISSSNTLFSFTSWCKRLLSCSKDWLLSVKVLSCCCNALICLLSLAAVSAVAVPMSLSLAGGLRRKALPKAILLSWLAGLLATVVTLAWVSPVLLWR